MLDLKRIDLGGLAYALEDRSDLHSWWLDPATGELELWSLDAENEEETHPDDRGLTSVDPIQPHEAYRDLEDFTSLVRDPRAHDLLERAIEGRGAFCRFKDTLFDFPELREAWHVPRRADGAPRPASARRSRRSRARGRRAGDARRPQPP